MNVAVGVAEFKSVAVGLYMLNKMTKTASINIVDNRILCIGKFLITISGEVADVQTAIDKVKAEAGDDLIVAGVIARVMDGVVEKINARIDRENIGALGIIETKNLSAGIISANSVKKTSQVELLRVSLTMGLGGKSVVTFTGDIASVNAALDAAAVELEEMGLPNKILSSVAIAYPSKDFVKSFNA